MIRYGKIRLRKPETEEDHHLQVEWRNGELARKSFYIEDEVTMAGHMVWHERVMADPDQRFYMIDAVTEPRPSKLLLSRPIPIGTTSLLKIDRLHRTAEYGRLLIGRSEYLGGGFASDAEYALMFFAFHHIGLNRIYGEVLTDNHAVLNLHRKLGFQEEGVLRQHIFKRGKFQDVVMVGLLASDLEAVQPRFSKAGGVHIVDE